MPSKIANPSSLSRVDKICRGARLLEKALAAAGSPRRAARVVAAAQIICAEVLDAGCGRRKPARDLRRAAMRTLQGAAPARA